MSAENVELVRGMYEAEARGDSAAALAVVDPRIVWVSSPGAVPLRGIEEFVRSLREWYELWADYDSSIEEYLDRGDQVIVISSMRARGRHSGVEVDSRPATVWTVRGGRVVRGEVFNTREEAVAAAGR